MSSFYEDASLVMIPSGYKTSKVYSAKPTDGAGDLDFTRSNDTATRVGPDGLIEKVRTNLALYSEDQTNAVWAKADATITGNAVANPLNGATTADKLVENTSNALHRVGQGAIAVTSGVPINFSFYAKAGERTSLEIQRINTSGTVFNVLTNNIINLTTGVVPSIVGATNYGSVSLGSGWFRYYFTLTPIASGSGGLNLGLVDGSGNVSYTGDGTSGAFIFGFQSETGDIATDYIATTSAAVSVGPVANVPRLDYLNSSCPRLLLEPQRTNVNTKSNDFTISSGYWYDYNSKTPVANQGTSPDGTNNAWSIPTSSLLTTEFGRTIGLTIGDKTAASIWAKGSETAFRLYIQNVSNSDILGSVTVNLTTGAITSGSGTVQSFGNGWYRISTIGTSTITNGYPRTIMSNPNTSCLIYGSQYEEGDYATSYIPTLGASVTRGADAASKTGISSLIGQTEGTLFVEGEAVTIDTSSNSPIYITVSNGNQNDICYIQQTLDGPIRVDYFAGGVRQARITSTTTYPLGTKIKAAFGYKSGDFVFYINGVLIGTETTGTSTAPLSKITIGAFETANFTGSAINQALLFKTRLPNSSLEELTTL